ncbi:unnamed protein product [Heligmosomoides polygyrus]|uniref:Uncharacterized protein n=1 Tax=Heligmosomoides polygyrus TaxID=6339 RepID=A0A183G8I9_HELPZ|nr:unnamed protein product [Heligmosomoides polygyrus]
MSLHGRGLHLRLFEKKFYVTRGERHIEVHLVTPTKGGSTEGATAGRPSARSRGFSPFFDRLHFTVSDSNLHRRLLLLLLLRLAGRPIGLPAWSRYSWIYKHQPKQQRRALRGLAGAIVVAAISQSDQDHYYWQRGLIPFLPSSLPQHLCRTICALCRSHLDRSTPVPSLASPDKELVLCSSSATLFLYVLCRSAELVAVLLVWCRVG